MQYAISFTVKDAATIFGVDADDNRIEAGKADFHSSVILEAPDMDTAIQLIEDYANEEFDGAKISRIEFKDVSEMLEEMSKETKELEQEMGNI